MYYLLLLQVTLVFLLLPVCKFLYLAQKTSRHRFDDVCKLVYPVLKGPVRGSSELILLLVSIANQDCLCFVCSPCHSSSLASISVMLQMRSNCTVYNGIFCKHVMSSFFSQPAVLSCRLSCRLSRCCWPRGRGTQHRSRLRSTWPQPRRRKHPPSLLARLGAHRWAAQPRRR